MKNILPGLRLLLTAFACLHAHGAAAQQDADMERIRRRFLDDLLRQTVRKADIERYIVTQRGDGTWPDIDYVDTSRTGFQHRVHLERMVALAHAHRKQSSPYRSSPAAGKAFANALDHWIGRNYISANWWWNEIGTPGLMIDFLLLADSALTPGQRRHALGIAARASLDSGFGARPGGDLIKIAGLLGRRALFMRDADILARVVRVMAGEIRITTERGLKPDLSFHHRTDWVISTLSYGLAYPTNIAHWGARLKGTRFLFPDSTLRLTVDYFLDGICKSAVYGAIPDIGAKNRGLTGPGALSPFKDAIAAELAQLTTHRKGELERIARIRSGREKPSLEWNTYFRYSEYATHQRPGWFSSVRMHSDRQQQNVEFPYNEEGLRNHHLADGANYVQVTGREYFDISPVWDWQKVPGTTVVQRDSLLHWQEIVKKGTSSFVGAVSDGRRGAVAMHLRSVHDPLEAKKAWFFFRDEYVCLGTGIRSGAGLRAATTVNQSLLDGAVTVFDGKATATLKMGEHTLDAPRWIHHGRVYYSFPEAATVHLRNRPAAGTWRSINHQEWATGDTVRKDVFLLWLEHTDRRNADGYAYVVTPAPDEPVAVNGSRLAEGVRILRNDSRVQAVHNRKDGVLQAVFHAPGTVELDDRRFSVDAPCMLMVVFDGVDGKPAAMHLSDPLRRSTGIVLTAGIGGAEGGRYSVPMPTGTSAGMTVRVTDAMRR